MKLEARLKGHYKLAYLSLKAKLQDTLSKITGQAGRYLVDHGAMGHTDRVIEYLEKLTESFSLELTNLEKYALLTSARLHDIGQYVNSTANGRILSEAEVREFHHELGRDLVLRNYALLDINNVHLARYIASIAYCHRRRVKIEEVFSEPDSIPIGESTLRPRMLAALLRLGDAMDCDYRRAPEIASILLRLPEENQRHWKASQLIAGVSVDFPQRQIRLIASTSNHFEKDLVRWKLEELYEELSTVIGLLSQYGVHIRDVVADVQNGSTGESEQLSGQRLRRQLEKSQREDLRRSQAYYSELTRIWSVRKTSIRVRIKRSYDLFHHYKDYPFAQETEAQLVYLSSEYTYEYRADGNSLVHNSFQIANISSMNVRRESFMVNGVIPMGDQEIQLKMKRKGSRLSSDFFFSKSTPTEKEVQCDFGNLKPLQKTTITMEYVWKYPLPLDSLRWNTFLINSFIVNARFNFLFPRGYKIGAAQAFRMKYPWVEKAKERLSLGRGARPALHLKVRLPEFDPAAPISYHVNIYVRKVRG
jgi:hypothetical protein